jgi:general stress protein 26
MEKKFGKDTFWALATHNGTEIDARIVDGYYEDGAIYVVTYFSKKMQQIAQNPNVAVCSASWFMGHGVGENLGWVLDAKNAQIMAKVREAFAKWYGNGHNDENDPNTCLLKIRLTDGVLMGRNTKYVIDFGEIDFAAKKFKPAVFPHELELPLKNSEFTTWEPLRYLSEAKKMVVEYEGTIKGDYAFARHYPSPWDEYKIGNPKITEEKYPNGGGKLVFDLAGTKGNQVRFVLWDSGECEKVKRVYLT